MTPNEDSTSLSRSMRANSFSNAALEVSVDYGLHDG